MKQVSRRISSALLVLVIAVPGVVNALCTDQTTWTSGYQVPFETELAASIAIVVGEVVAEHKVFETPEDPEAYSVIYTVRSGQVLMGNPLKVFKLREELDSGRYGMARGETHLLFITKWRWKVRGADYVIDPCGNSKRLPEGDEVLARVKKALAKKARAP